MATKIELGSYSAASYVMQRDTKTVSGSGNFSIIIDSAFTYVTLNLSGDGTMDILGGVFGDELEVLVLCNSFDLSIASGILRESSISVPFSFPVCLLSFKHSGLSWQLLSIGSNYQS
jgi:hypothetical protein